MTAEPEADAIALQMFVESLRACSDPTKRRAADVIEGLRNRIKEALEHLAFPEQYRVTEGEQCDECALRGCILSAINSLTGPPSDDD